MAKTVTRTTAVAGVPVDRLEAELRSLKLHKTATVTSNPAHLNWLEGLRGSDLLGEDPAPFEVDEEQLLFQFSMVLTVTLAALVATITFIRLNSLGVDWALWAVLGCGLAFLGLCFFIYAKLWEDAAPLAGAEPWLVAFLVASSALAVLYLWLMGQLIYDGILAWETGGGGNELRRNLTGILPPVLALIVAVVGFTLFVRAQKITFVEADGWARSRASEFATRLISEGGAFATNWEKSVHRDHRQKARRAQEEADKLRKQLPIYNLWWAGLMAVPVILFWWSNVSNALSPGGVMDFTGFNGTRLLGTLLLAGSGIPCLAWWFQHSQARRRIRDLFRDDES